MSEDRRADLLAAFDEHEASDESTGTPAGEGEGSGEEGAGAATPPSPPARKPDAGGEDADVDVDAAKQPPAGKVKDPVTGKFVSTAPALGADGKPVPQNAPAGQKAPVGSPAPQPVRAPVSWRPEVREKFAALPKEVQDEVFRRETEINNGLRQTAEVRQYAQAMHQTIQPYEAMIRAENGNPVSAVANLFQTAYILRTAPPQQKAQLVAQMIMQHGIDVEMLDGALSGMVTGRQGQQQRGPDPNVQYIEQQLAPIKQFFTGLQAQQQTLQQQQGQNLQSELQTFAADPKNEFFADVSADMADFLELAANRGQKMTLQEAYTRATLAHPTISELIANRRVSAGAAQRQQQAQRSRNASASLPSGGAPAEGEQGKAKPNDRRSAIEAAWEEAEAKTN